MNIVLRRPPAFQLYASDLLADRRFLLMTAAERGLLLSMRAACWVGDEVPRDPGLLARIVGLPLAEVEAALSDAVLSFFAEVPNGTNSSLHDPELAAQMQRLLARRTERAESGRRGGEAKRDKAKLNGIGVRRKPPSSGGSSATGSAGSSLSRAEQSRTEQNQTPSVERVHDRDASWLEDFDRHNPDRALKQRRHA